VNISIHNDKDLSEIVGMRIIAESQDEKNFIKRIIEERIDIQYTVSKDEIYITIPKNDGTTSSND